MREKRVSIRITEEIHKKLEEIAKKEDLPVSIIFRRAIYHYIKEKDNDEHS